MEHLQTYMNSVESSVVSDWMYDHIDFLGYIVGFYMAFLCWFPPVMKWFLIRFGIFNPSILELPIKSMPPLGSPDIALVQLICNLVFCYVGLSSGLQFAYPLLRSVKEVGFHDSICVYQEAAMERGPVVFAFCTICVFLYVEVLYSGLMAAQNIYKQMEVAKNRGLPVPAKVTSGVRFIEYVYRSVTMGAPWHMFTIQFSPILVTMSIGSAGMFMQHALFAIQHVCMIVAPRFAADHEFKFLIVRNMVRFTEGAIGFPIMFYTYFASNCNAIDFTNRIAMVYYSFIMFFMYVDLKKMYLTRENPMLSIYENDQPENRLQKAKQN